MADTTNKGQPATSKNLESVVPALEGTLLRSRRDKGFGNDSAVCSTRAGTEQNAPASGVPVRSGSASNAPVNPLTRLLQINGEDHPTVAYLGDLTKFHSALSGPLEAARELLDKSDTELADEVGRIHTRAHQLVTGAAKVFVNHAVVAQQTSCGVLPGLNAALWAPRAKRTVVASLLGLVQGWIGGLRNDTKEIRRSYVLLLEQTYYIRDCVQVAQDGLCMELMGPSEDEVKARHPDGRPEVALEAVDELEGEATPPGAATEAAMEDVQTAEVRQLVATMGKLACATGVLQECSDFWLFLHTTERQLIHLEQSAQQLRSTLLSGPRTSELPSGFRDFCALLDQLCVQFCAAGSRSDVELMRQLAAFSSEGLGCGHSADSASGVGVFGSAVCSITNMSTAANAPGSTLGKHVVSV